MTTPINNSCKKSLILPFKYSGAVVAVVLALTTIYFKSLDNVRGPYLQNPSSTSMVIKWRNNGSLPAYVAYGTSPQKLLTKVGAKSNSTNHEVQLENLYPGTLYYYRLNSSEESVFQFRTPPVEGEVLPTRVWILGDSGKYVNALKIRDSFYRFNKGSKTDLIIMLGDNAYEYGSDNDYQETFFKVFEPSLHSTPVYSTIGNHDARTGNGKVFFDIFNFPSDGKAGGVPSGTEAYYSFNYSNIHFVCLDSVTSDRSLKGAMYSWLKDDLSANTQLWTVVFFHHPPYTKGQHDSDDKDSAMSDMRENFTPVFDLYGVDFVLSGHSHNYERSFPIVGHTGNSSTFLQSMKSDFGNGRREEDGVYRKNLKSNNSGVIYTVAGSAGKVTRNAPLDHPAHYISMNQPGSVVLDFNGKSVDATFVSPNPESIDNYTVEK